MVVQVIHANYGSRSKFSVIISLIENLLDLHYSNFKQILGQGLSDFG